jgi:hypothetical protein
MNYPVTVEASWILEDASFVCDSTDIPAGQSAVVRCSTRAPVLSGARLAQGLVALKAGQERAQVNDLKITIPSLAFKLRVSLLGVEVFDRSEHAEANNNLVKARRQIADTPCESTNDCIDRAPTRAEARGMSYAKLAMWALAFAAILGVRFWLGSDPIRWLRVPWTFYSLAGVAAIVIATIDPPQPGSGDGMVHGVLGQLSLYVLAAPWSSIIVTTPGVGSTLGLLMLAVLANILYGAILVFVGDRTLRD